MKTSKFDRKIATGTLFGYLKLVKEEKRKGPSGTKVTQLTYEVRPSFAVSVEYDDTSRDVYRAGTLIEVTPG